ncbi:hypothetical protein HN51_067939 [Arachis hypogaea]
MSAPLPLTLFLFCIIIFFFHCCMCNDSSSTTTLQILKPILPNKSPGSGPSHPSTTTIPAFPEQFDVKGCPLTLSDELFDGIKNACGGGGGGGSDMELHHTRCCPVLASWLYYVYSSTALTHSHTHTSSLSYEMPLLPDDSETYVNDLENALKVRGIQLKRPNETCDVVFCFCGIRLHPLSCPDAFSVNENGELVGDKTVRRLEKNCISRTNNVNGFPGLGGCSKCLNTLYRMRASGLLLKFLEAILKAGNRMNARTSRGNAQGFNLSALRKLSDVKSIDGKASLLHFIVEQVAQSKGRREAMNQKHNISKINGDISNSNENNNSLVQHETEKEYLMLGLQVLLGGIKDELSEVKKAAIIDHQNFIRMLYILNARVSKIREIVTKCCGENNERGGFVKEMKGFVEECEEELKVVKDEHLRIMELVKKTNEKFIMAQPKTRIGLAGLAVMGQNLALNIAEKGFPISVYNRTTSKVDETVERAKHEGNLPVYGYHDPEAFVNSIQKPRVIIMLVKAGAPVDQTIKTLSTYLEKGDCIIDGGNEWYENTERREKAVAELGLLYLGMGVSGGEEGARNGPSLMPGGSFEAFKYIEDILLKVAAQVPDSGPCVTYVGKGGSGNFVKMIHNGIEYGDMQLIAEAYDVLKSVGKLSNEELHNVFAEWNKGELLSFLIEITADIFGIKDDKGDGYLVDKVLDKTGMKGTGKWTVQQAAELSVAAPTIESSLDARFLSGLKEERVEAAKVFKSAGFGDILADQSVDKQQLIDDVRKALYAAKICSYAQGMNLIRAKSIEKGWDLKLGELARIWKGGCIIRAIFLDRIKKAYDRNPNLANLLVDPEFAKEIIDRQSAWRRVVCLAINSGISTPGMSASLAYFDTYRRERLPANLVQAQRDYFGAHTYERIDIEGSYHTEWFKLAKQSKI